MCNKPPPWSTTVVNPTSDASASLAVELPITVSLASFSISGSATPLALILTRPVGVSGVPVSLSKSKVSTSKFRSLKLARPKLLCSTADALLFPAHPDTVFASSNVGARSIASLLCSIPASGATSWLTITSSLICKL